MNEQQRREYLGAMGVDQLLLRTAEPESKPKQTVTTVDNRVQNTESLNKEIQTSVKIGTWDGLREQIKSCSYCVLHKTRIQTVFGVGNEQADWMIIGEAPGAQEDQQGEPFVGRAGLLLNEILFSLGLKRNSVFIANILKCRPPNNRDPLPNEIEACGQYLKQQVEHVAPKLILALGRIAAQNLLQTSESIGHLRGRIHYYQTIPVIVIYHPAYLLRSPIEKRKVQQDLILARQTLEQFPDSVIKNNE